MDSFLDLPPHDEEVDLSIDPLAAARLPGSSWPSTQKTNQTQGQIYTDPSMDMSLGPSFSILSLDDLELFGTKMHAMNHPLPPIKEAATPPMSFKMEHSTISPGLLSTGSSLDGNITSDADGTSDEYSDAQSLHSASDDFEESDYHHTDTRAQPHDHSNGVDWYMKSEINDIIATWIEENQEIKKRSFAEHKAKAVARTIEIHPDVDEAHSIEANSAIGHEAETEVEFETKAKVESQTEACDVQITADHEYAATLNSQRPSTPTGSRHRSTPSSPLRRAGLGSRRKSESSVQHTAKVAAPRTSRRSSSLSSTTSTPTFIITKPTRSPVKRKTKSRSRTSQITPTIDEGKPFKCDECSNSFKRQEHLKRHQRSVHTNYRPFECKYCEKTFSRSDNLAQHHKTHEK
ncbi:CYFA0S16e01552g1_1 [Cyberlindnera fabianii]|uniref:CYFA0S16e01552g1_1 n=1 Tax=Cyberlindnera fabianii TaxID=36022 RepID=A0A061B550_CYBFA|nr:CYFA0S16e01552g1_1 [Cyberlindnera fabianii]